MSIVAVDAAAVDAAALVASEDVASVLLALLLLLWIDLSLDCCYVGGGSMFSCCPISASSMLHCLLPLDANFANLFL